MNSYKLFLIKDNVAFFSVEEPVNITGKNWEKRGNKEIGNIETNLDYIQIPFNSGWFIETEKCQELSVIEVNENKSSWMKSNVSFGERRNTALYSGASMKEFISYLYSHGGRIIEVKEIYKIPGIIETISEAINMRNKESEEFERI